MKNGPGATAPAVAASAAAGAKVAPPVESGWIGHPRGLFVLFFAEMWERFSYYGMRALLIFYLVEHWLFSDGEASLIYGAYTALVYIMPIIGGYAADRWLGQRKAVLYGAVLLSCGHLLMAVEGSGGQQDITLNVFWLALSFIIVGSGFLKANISVIVGQLYRRTDKRRDAAYTIFYMGINLGAALGALGAGWLGQTVGWSWGFGAAGFGMVVGLIVFAIGKPWLDGKGEAPDPARLCRRHLGLSFEWWLYLGGLAAVAVNWVLVQNESVVGALLGISGALLLLYILYVAVFTLPPDERDRLFAALFLMIGSILFWALFEQAGSSLNLFTDRSVDRHIFGIEVKASMFQSLNAIYIVTLAPLFAMLWVALGKRGREPSTTVKFGLGLMQLGLGFLVLVWGAAFASPETGLTPVLFVFLLYLLHTTGELCLSPVGLSAMNRLSPLHLAGLVMGTWFFASAAGNFASGMIAAATSGSEGVATAESTLAVYTKVGWAAIATGVVVLGASPLVTRWMHLDTLADEDARDEEARESAV